MIIGTRASPLAIAQAMIVARKLRRKNREITVLIRKIVAEGDLKIKYKSSLAGKELFTKKIDEALIRKEIDIAVHSLKDVPVENTNEDKIEIAAYPKREDPADILISKKKHNLKDIPNGSRIGTSSVRRAIQLKNVRSDLKIVDLHGNVGTRLSRLKDSKLDAIVLAKAGLKRLGYHKLGTRIPFELMLPAPGQGCLAVSIRADDSRSRSLVKSIDHKETRIAATAERAFSKYLGGGCNTPVAAYAQVTKGKLQLEGLIQGAKSSRIVVRGNKVGSTKDPVGLGRSLAAQLKAVVDKRRN